MPNDLHADSWTIINCVSVADVESQQVLISNYFSSTAR